LDTKALGRWWIVGLLFYGVSLGILYFLTGVLRLPLIISTSVGSEILSLLRFWINERWVFRQRGPFTWKRLWQFHVAYAGGFAIWWLAGNLLPLFGIHYLIASTIGTACSVGTSMTTHFFWVWRKGAMVSQSPYAAN